MSISIDDLKRCSGFFPRLRAAKMFKAGQLVKIKDVRKGALSVSYVPVYVIENNQRVVEHTSKGCFFHKMKKLPLHSICLFIKQDKEKLSHLLHEEQIIECHTDWIEPL